MSSSKVVPFDGDGDNTTSKEEEEIKTKKSMTKVEALLAKKNQIKALNSFNDQTGKRLRILRAQVRPSSLLS